MEDDRKKTLNSGDTMPETPSSIISDFEFGSLTPFSPTHSENSPADHLFLNGRLLPHTFPTTRSVSRTTSENTFRSNSTSSRSSDSSSPTSYTPRTSTCSVLKIKKPSTDQEKTNLTCFGPRSKEIMGLRSGICRSSKAYHHKPSSILDLKKKPLTNNGKTVNTTRAANKILYFPTQCKRKKATEIVTAQLYGSYSRRWQHITPVFKREWSVKSNGAAGIKVSGRKKKTARRRKKKKAEESKGSKLMKWWKMILKAVVLACRECHAMEPQRVVNDDAADVKKKIIKCR
ncbi:hypothetical protein EUTSA_v10012165mg [Eutrema salsugineum]|uniref:Uncharacterized protein n=1 Tax=Eutrema salsugineum TaxID=72664 RepID=V4KRY5_EUTSA|nr:probable membrane-associated kinase regulator 1 [Eutrema salsugineum]ESQ30108.1 hypothetical protein EUTSA_v10012165mg [Eutrema salsugineum]